ncbi:hypothetical protein Bbelb_333790 [Branchiostoma belcheri]|nr:hypothetical protein Bbelb_333790 [Branchiostoma belcheri]
MARDSDLLHGPNFKPKKFMTKSTYTLWYTRGLWKTTVLRSDSAHRSLFVDSGDISVLYMTSIDLVIPVPKFKFIRLASVTPEITLVSGVVDEEAKGSGFESPVCIKAVSMPSLSRMRQVDNDQCVILNSAHVASLM